MRAPNCATGPFGFLHRKRKEGKGQLHLLQHDLHYNARMWMGPLLYIGVSIFLWRYLGAVFVPALMARSVFAIMPALLDLELMVLINSSLIYFAVYFVFAMYWPRLKPHFKNPFVAGLALWLVNILVLFPSLEEVYWGIDCRRDGFPQVFRCSCLIGCLQEGCNSSKGDRENHSASSDRLLGV